MVRRGGSERVRRAPFENRRRRAGMDRGGFRVGRRRPFAGISSKKVGRRKRTPPVPKILDGEAEARVIAMYEGQQGYANWSLRLLAGQQFPLRGRHLQKARRGSIDAGGPAAATHLARFGLAPTLP